MVGVYVRREREKAELGRRDNGVREGGRKEGKGRDGTYVGMLRARMRM